MLEVTRDGGKGLTELELFLLRQGPGPCHGGAQRRGGIEKGKTSRCKFTQKLRFFENTARSSRLSPQDVPATSREETVAPREVTA